MRIAVRRVPAGRLPDVPRWALAVVALWAAVVLAGVWFGERSGQEFVACYFRRFVGHPCPTCGSTRAVLALARGAWLEELAWNPLIALALPTLALLSLLRAATAKRFTLELDRGGRALLWTVAAAAALANWAWIWDRS